MSAMDLFDKVAMNIENPALFKDLMYKSERTDIFKYAYAAKLITKDEIERLTAEWMPGVPILENVELDVSQTGYFSGYCAEIKPFPLFEYDTIHVKIDNEVYYYVPMNGNGMYGSSSYTDYPFYIYSVNVGGNMPTLQLWLPESKIVTLSIYKEEE